jgi:AbiV family abortive infection protein
MKNTERRNLVKDCLESAKRLLESSKILYAETQYSSAFLLAVLSLEEIGKKVLLESGWVEDLSGKKIGPTPKFDDHIFKILMGLWSAGEKLDHEHIQRYRNLFKFSEELHYTRLNSTYAPTDPSIKIKIITKPYCEKIIKIVNSRIKIELIKKTLKENKDSKEIAEWLVKIFGSDDLKKLCYSGASIKKLYELKDYKKWFDWLKEIVELREIESEALKEKELSRVVNSSDATNNIDKWKISARFYLPTHNLDQKSLKDWNARSNNITLKAAGAKGKDQLLVEIVLPKRVLAKDLWEVGYSISTQLYIALNIGCRGYIGREKIEYQSKYYEEIIDIESSQEFVVEIKKNQDFAELLKKVPLSLGKNELNDSFVILNLMPRILSNDRTFEIEAFGHYHTFLVLTGKANSFSPRLLNEAFYHLYLAFIKFSSGFKDIIEPENLKDLILDTFGSDICRDVDLETLTIYWKKIMDEKLRSQIDDIKLSHILNFKILLDSYLIKKYRAVLLSKVINSNKKSFLPTTS